MSMEIETVLVVSVMMAVFSTVMAVGTAIVLGAAFKRLSYGFEIIKKQTGFFSDTIYMLEENIDNISKTISNMDKKDIEIENKINIVRRQISFLGTLVDSSLEGDYSKVMRFPALKNDYVDNVDFVGSVHIKKNLI